MNKILTLAFIFVVTAFAQVGVKNIVEIDGFNSPESVYVYKKDIFVSNVGEKLEPLSKDGDGFISLLNEKGEIVELKFIEGFDAPKGMSVLKKVLYVTDIDSVKGYNLETKEKVFELKIDGAVFLNDITKSKNRYIFVSDTGTGGVYRVDTEKVAYTKLLDIAGPNGLLYDEDNKTLWIAGYVEPKNGKLWSVKIEKGKAGTPLAHSSLEGMLDGIAKTKDGDLIVSDWGENLEGSVYVVKSNGEASKLELPYIKGPADLYRSGKYLWIPKMAEGKVLRVELK